MPQERGPGMAPRWGYGNHTGMGGVLGPVDGLPQRGGPSIDRPGGRGSNGRAGRNPHACPSDTIHFERSCSGHVTPDMTDVKSTGSQKEMGFQIEPAALRHRHRGVMDGGGLKLYCTDVYIVRLF